MRMAPFIDVIVPLNVRVIGMNHGCECGDVKKELDPGDSSET
jgi:hypothetical protein